MQLCGSLSILWHCLSRDWNENWPFPVLWPLLSFQICWHIECSTFTAPSFRMWNSSIEIPSPSLALLVVMLPKAHLTSYSRMSGSRWAIIPSWLFWSWRSFLYSSSVYSCHLFLISCASVRSIPFLSFIEPIFAWNVLFVSLIFLKRSLVFPILLFSSLSLHFLSFFTGEGFLISPCYSLELCIQRGISFLFSFAFSFSSFLSYLAPKSLRMVTWALKWRHLLLGRKAMTNLDSILKSRDITLPKKACLVEAMVFPVVMYGWES